MSYQVLNPTNETSPEQIVIAPRLASLKGTRVGIISNGKEGTKRFFTHLEHMLYEELEVKEVVVRQKSNYSAPAEAELLLEAGNWDVAVTGIGD